MFQKKGELLYKSAQERNLISNYYIVDNGLNTK